MLANYTRSWKEKGKRNDEEKGRKEEMEIFN